MSAYLDFVKNCANPPIGIDFAFFVENAIKDLYAVSFEKEKKELVKFLTLANENETINTVAIGLQKCKEYCEAKKKKVSRAETDDNLLTFELLLKNTIKTLESVLNKSLPSSDENKTSPTDFQAVFDSYDKKIEELQNKLESVSGSVHEQYNLFDSKVFQLLVNTVSILGIFVAIAFAGFGGMSLLSNITIDMTNNFYSSVFTLFLIALFVYNMLLLLIYFIFVILRTFGNGNRFPFRFVNNRVAKANFTELRAWQTFKPLFIVDIVLFIMTVILFFIA